MDTQLVALRNRVAELETQHEKARIRAYRQARIFEPSMDGYHAAMSTYTAAFGPPDGEITVVLPDGSTRQGWELDGSSLLLKFEARAEAAEQARAALQAALQSLLSEPYGCSLCDSGKPRNEKKGHQPDCPYERARAILAAQHKS